MARKVKSAKNIQKQLLLAIRHVVLVAKYCGVIPVTTNKWYINPTTKLSNMFIPQKTGLIYTLLHIVCLLYMYKITVHYIYWVYNVRSPLLLQVVCIMICNIVRGTLINIYALSYRIKLSIVCLNSSIRVVSSIKHRFLNSAHWIIFVQYFLFISGSIPLLIRWIEGVSAFVTFPFVFNNFQEVSMNTLMLTLFTVVELSLNDINKTISKLQERHINLSPKIEALMFRHWQTCDLFINMSQCFGLDVVLLCWYNLTKIVLLSYYSYFMIVTRYSIWADHIITVTDVPYRFFTIWYMGKKCDEITFQITESRRLLAELLINCRDNLDDKSKDAMLQMSATYIVLLAQFQSFM